MYDIELFKNIFSEGEILCMDDEFLELLRRLLDDKMSVRFLQFLERFEQSEIPKQANDPIARTLVLRVAKMKEVLLPTAKQNTFHLEVTERNIFEFIGRLHIDTALLVITDRKGTIETLEWLLGNRNNWLGYIPIRQKEDYEMFFQKCYEMEYATRSTQMDLENLGIGVSIERYDNLTERIKANKEFFFSNNERKRSTRMTNIMSMADTLEVILHGLKYQELCNQREIPKIVRRSFSA